jgi:hypothetical protein
MDPEQFSTLEQPRFEFALEVRLRFTRVQQITQLPTGGIRSAVYVDSGEFHGPKLKGKAVPNSGGDYALFRPDDVAIFDARYMLQEDDGTLILLHNKGFLWGRTPDVMDRLRKWAFEGGAPVPHAELSPRNQQKARALGLTSATGLVIGSIIGTGVFAMPAVLAGAGTSSLLTLGVIAVGATLLAIMFGQLTKRVPNSDGGLYAYARHEFGDFAGYLTGWCYWIQAWAGNAAIVSAWVFYVDALFGINPSGIGNWGIALGGLWIPALVNLAGVRQMAWFQNLTVVLKFLPLLFVGVAGWFFVKTANFGAFNASGGSLYKAIGIAAGVALFSFIGVEVAAITVKRVKNPRINVGRASLLGTGASAILYLAVSAAIMGLVPHHELVNSTAPFVTAFGTIFTHGAWAGKLVAALAVTSGIGALNGWTLVTTESWWPLPWSPWPSRTCSRPAPSSPTWCPGAAGCRAGCSPGT